MYNTIAQASQVAQAPQVNAGYEAIQAATTAQGYQVPNVAAYSASDATAFAQLHEQSIAAMAQAKELVGNGADAAIGGFEAAVLATEAAAATTAGVVAGFALPVALGAVGVIGLGAMSVYTWKHKGWTIESAKQAIADTTEHGKQVVANAADSVRNRLAKQSEQGTYPQWEGWTDETIWNDDALLEAETRPTTVKVWAHEVDVEKIDWDALALECAA